MSVIALTEAKEFLRVIHNADDALVQRLLDAAEARASKFLGRESLITACAPTSSSSSSEALSPAVTMAVLLFVQSRYEASKPDEQLGLDRMAEDMLSPFRCGVGV